MRTSFLQVASLFTLFTLPFAAAHPRHHPRSYSGHSRVSRDLDAPPPLPAAPVLHQHHVPRDLLDICVYLDADVLAQSLLGIPLNLLVDLDLCLCLSLLPLEITANVQLAAIVDILGIDALTAILTTLINDSPGREHCAYPPHTQPICSKGDPCGWDCDTPYIKEGDQCVCPPSLSLCNGVCGSFPHGCGSSAPSAKKRSNGGGSVDSAFGITTLAEAQATCPPHETVCGVYGGSARSFECLDVNTQLESCGGCAIPNPFISATLNASKPGVDCASLAGVDHVTCISGKCAVSSCVDGWVVGPDGDECVEAQIATGPGSQTRMQKRRRAEGDAGSVADADIHLKNRDVVSGLVTDVMVGAVVDVSKRSAAADVSVDLDVTKRDLVAEVVTGVDAIVLTKRGLLVADAAAAVDRRQIVANVGTLVDADLPPVLDVLADVGVDVALEKRQPFDEVITDADADALAGIAKRDIVVDVATDVDVALDSVVDLLADVDADVSLAKRQVLADVNAALLASADKRDVVAGVVADLDLAPLLDVFAAVGADVQL